MDSHVLIDYDNLPLHVGRAGLVSLARALVKIVSVECPTTQDTRVRLYGGWYDQAGLSNAGSLLTQEIQRSFPILMLGNAGHLRRVHCEIASALVNSRSDLFFHTYREKRGIPSVLRSQTPTGCTNPPNCTILAVIKWSRRSCPEDGCPVKSQDAFTYSGQKLVDTLLSCDLVTLSRQRPLEPVFVLSDDDDLIPPILLAGINCMGEGTRIWHIRSSDTSLSLYDAALLRKNVRILKL